MKIQFLVTILGAAMINGTVSAHNLQSEQVVPPVKVAEFGEIVIIENSIALKPWYSSSLPGKVRVVHHLAGRTAAKEKNQPMIDAIKAAHFDQAKYQTTTIINADDAIVGTGMFVKRSAEKGKIENPHSQVILDDKGAVKNAWSLQEKDSLIIVLDKQGKVKFAKEGALSQNEIQTVLALLKDLMR